MRRNLVFILLVFAAFFTALSSLIVFRPEPVTSGMMPGMMSSMMGESMSSTPLLWPTALTMSALAILVGLVYLIAFPTIKLSESDAALSTNYVSTGALDPLAVLIRVSKPEERAVLEVLRNSGGVCHQKDIVFKTGLSKIKVHRIIARLAERGAIQVKRIGKTNEVTIPAWLIQNRADSPQG